MKKNKKHGFTLIELLAIIVILAIIAVITVPIILNIIEDSKKGSVQDSAYGYIEAVEKDYVSKLINDSSPKLNGTYIVSDGEFNDEEINLSGSKPTDGYLIYENNKLTSGCLEFDGYKAEYKNGKFTSEGKGNCSVDVIYYTLDPNAEYSINGQITSKVDLEHKPSEWEFWIKQSTFTGVSYYGMQVIPSVLVFDTENECTTTLEMYGAQDTYECESISSGYTLNQGSMQNYYIFDDETQCIALKNTFSEQNQTNLSCVDLSNKYAVLMRLNVEEFSTIEECNNRVNECKTSGIECEYAYSNPKCVKNDTKVKEEVCGIYDNSGNEPKYFCLVSDDYEGNKEVMRNLGITPSSINDETERASYTYQLSNSSFQVSLDGRGIAEIEKSEYGYCSANTREGQYSECFPN